MITTLVPLYRHCYWANRRVLEQLEEAPERYGEAQRLFAHMMARDWLWLARLTGSDANRFPLWPDLSLAECKTLLDETEARFRRYFQALAEEDLDQHITYRTTQGIEYTTPIRDMLREVCLHDSYIRGQIAAVILREGGKPIDAEYITYVRSR